MKFLTVFEQTSTYCIVTSTIHYQNIALKGVSASFSDVGCVIDIFIPFYMVYFKVKSGILRMSDNITYPKTTVYGKGCSQCSCS